MSDILKKQSEEDMTQTLAAAEEDGIKCKLAGCEICVMY